MATYEEEVRKLEEQIETRKARLQQMKAKQKEKTRKERTKRLIQEGAILEKSFGETDFIFDSEEKLEILSDVLNEARDGKPTIGKYIIDQVQRRHEALYHSDES